MAAFCECCGSEITLKAEACSVCGTPRHGMTPAVPVDSLAKVPEPAPALGKSAPGCGVLC
jgi:hypothetical protein